MMWYAILVIFNEILTYYLYHWIKLQVVSPFSFGCDALLNFSLLFTVVMIVFFSDLLNAKLFLQKTVIFGAIVFIFLFAFSFVEHFVVHWLAQFLQIHNIYVSSTFACIIGMFFHPVKKKLEKWLKFDENEENPASADFVISTFKLWICNPFILAATPKNNKNPPIITTDGFF